MKRKKGNGLKRLLKFVYIKLVRINDSPQRIALGLGAGTALGILPGTGPIAALCVAWLLRINRMAALLGSLLTNTWLSLVTFLASVRIGSLILRLDWHEVYGAWLEFLKNISWKNFLKLPFLKVILPVAFGYLVVALVVGSVVYFITIVILMGVKHGKKT
ncbi:MAG: DUF2062 domain-containing protein [Candidatus Omnitrophica bacterium]|nr:DUF2062 domain-containing protein [Candidatus Omnitrophota bacterium]